MSGTVASSIYSSSILLNSRVHTERNGWFDIFYKHSYTLYQSRQEHGILSVYGYNWSWIKHLGRVCNGSDLVPPEVSTDTGAIGIWKSLYYWWKEQAEAKENVQVNVDFHGFWQTLIDSLLLEKDARSLDRRNMSSESYNFLQEKYDFSSKDQLGARLLQLGADNFGGLNQIYNDENEENVK